jgi:tetratricopeptide (TPR) repeat protein
MSDLSPHIAALYQQAEQYRQQGDTYNAVKLFKHVARAAPEWSAPFFQLGAIYKYRQEWKPALHYIKRAVALDPTNREAWWDLAIAASALKKNRISRSIWQKFGWSLKTWAPAPVSIKTTYGDQFEIMWADSRGPASAEIQNIPYPLSGRRYRDLVLFDRVVTGYHIVDKRRFPVYLDLGLLKRSEFQTFSCLLEMTDDKAVRLLQKLCEDEGLGFEIWSNAVREYQPKRVEMISEHYSPRLWSPGAGQPPLAALAARREKDALRVLRAWQVISLGRFLHFERHH